MEEMVKHVRPLVRDLLQNWASRRWSLQGFGMLRTYISKELRLHVWDQRFSVPRVSTIHDHPWDFDSLVLSGRIVNTRYQVHPCRHSDQQIERFRLRLPFFKTQIVCGPGGGVTSDAMERVWLMPVEPETYEAGCTYRQRAAEVHHTSYSDGAVTLVHRQFHQDTEHAHVFFRVDEKWISAEPRDATPDEVSQIVGDALSRF